MPAWNQVLEEIDQEVRRTDSFTTVRQKYLKQLFEKRGRNIISYYSGWLQKHGVWGVAIDDSDKNAFMCVIHDLDRKKGLDLILHTPGGDATATESLVDYLKEMFGSNIEVFVPQIAMSAGTMIACASRLIHMGKQSSLGPIDPQIGDISAGAVLDEFEKAAEEIKTHPEKVSLWSAIYNRCLPSTILSCERAMQLAGEIAEKWLGENMFADDQKNVSQIVYQLLNHQETKTHTRHIGLKQAQEIGLKVEPLEKDDELQDIVLTIHHTYMHTLASTPIVKIIENHNNVKQGLIFDPSR